MLQRTSLGLALAGVAAMASAQEGMRCRETVLAETEGRLQPGDVAVAPDHSRVLYAQRSSDGWLVFLSPATTPVARSTADRPLELQFDASATHWGCVLHDGDAWHALVDGKITAACQRVGNLTLAPGTARSAHFAKRTGAWYAVIDGKDEGPYDALIAGSLHFAPDGTRVAYAARRGAQVFPVVDGKAGESYLAIGNGTPVWSPDSKHLAYDAMVAGGRIVVADGVRSDLFGGLSRPSWSPDNQVAYIFGPTQERLTTVVVGGKAGPQHDGIGKFGVAFSPDGKRHAYIHRQGSQRGVVVDGEAGPLHDDAIAPFFSADGARVGYFAKNGSTWCVIADGKPGPGFAGILETTRLFAPRGDRTAYVGFAGTKVHLVVDGVTGRPWDAVGKAGISFDEQGAHHACAVAEAGTWRLACDGIAQGRLDALLDDGRVVFAADGRATLVGRHADEIVRLEVQIAN